jgi:hypothetical protein
VKRRTRSITKRPIDPERTRRIPAEGFSWLDRRFVREGLIEPLALEAILLYFFEKRIRPVLIDNCYGCHSTEAQTAGKLKGGLLLDTREGIRRGGDTAAAVVPGDVEAAFS